MIENTNRKDYYQTFARFTYPAGIISFAW